MPSILLAYGSTERGGLTPTLKTVNMIAEPSATETEKALVLISRPGQEDFATVGSGPIRGVFQKDGLFNGDAIVVSGQTVYRVASNGVVTALTGTLDGYYRVDMAGGQDEDANPEVRIATGDAHYLVTETAVDVEALPDGVGAASIMQLSRFWFAAITDTGRALIKLPGEAWAMLDSVAAEKEPDALVAIRPLGDLIVLMGSSSLEGWQFTGQADPAVSRVSGQVFPVGCLARDTAVVVDTSLIFVASDFTVREYTTFPTIISDFGLAALIKQAAPATLRAWTCSIDQHSYYILRIGNTATKVFDFTNRLWSDWVSYGEDYFTRHLGAQVGGRVLAASDSDGTLTRMDADMLTDAGDPLVRRFAGFVPIKGGVGICDSVTLLCEVGQGLQTGQGSDPVIAMRYSTDQGKTWSDWEFETLGAVGEYEWKVTWRRLGQFEPPGIYFEWEITDPVSFRVSDARINEA